MSRLWSWIWRCRRVSLTVQYGYNQAPGFHQSKLDSVCCISILQYNIVTLYECTVTMLDKDMKRVGIASLQEIRGRAKMMPHTLRNCFVSNQTDGINL